MKHESLRHSSVVFRSVTQETSDKRQNDELKCVVKKVEDSKLRCRHSHDFLRAH